MFSRGVTPNTNCVPGLVKIYTTTTKHPYTLTAAEDSTLTMQTMPKQVLAFLTRGYIEIKITLENNLQLGQATTTTSTTTTTTTVTKEEEDVVVARLQTQALLAILAWLEANLFVPAPHETPVTFMSKSLLVLMERDKIDGDSIRQMELAALRATGGVEVFCSVEKVPMLDVPDMPSEMDYHQDNLVELCPPLGGRRHNKNDPCGNCWHYHPLT
eukprot:GHVS01070837.1.p1 GENE.GHVS01070837.1~~GHVS01070837.1.p1  ORF type:complete len:214 (+),score=45.34 GHVS01070837.1:291-932(+)